MFHLKEGDKAPAITANDQNGKSITLSDFSGKKVVLYFYPKDDTPGCTAEACSFRDAHQSLLDKGLIVLGVSPDSEKSHAKFVDKYKLPFSLLSDGDKKIANDYGVWGKKKFMGKEYDGIHRTTFIIDETGKIEKIITKVDTKDSSGQILSELGL
jgi:peroxiredoxin Q/BCP